MITVAVAALASCVSPVEELTRPEYESYGSRVVAPPTEPLPEYDAGVVDAPQPGSVTEGSPSHDVEQTSSGRMHILELYQSSIDERDVLKMELASSTRSLEQARAEIARLSGELAESVAHANHLQGERDRLLAETEELASRLVTAQIRRLEAEKVLLESKLEWHRAGAVVVEAKTEGAPEEPHANSRAATEGSP